MLPDLKVSYMENLEGLIVTAHLALTIDALDNARQLHVPAARALTSKEVDVMSPFPITRSLTLLQALSASACALLNHMTAYLLE
ncbi:hypothetical protein EV121DRAFT_292162 [Schizophyllum commune]